MATTFQTKSFTAITAGMINHLRSTQSKLTDFVPGSKARTLLEAGAIEIDQYYEQVVSGILAAIPVAIFQSFNFPALGARAAGGPITVAIVASSNNIDIPAGTVFTDQTLGTRFTSTLDVVIPAGSTLASVSVLANVAGAASNLPAGEQFTLSPTPTGLTSASNPGRFVGGQDAETPDQQKVRFQAYIQSLARGTDSALSYGCSQATLTNTAGAITEKVSSATVYDPPPPQGQGTQPVTVYIHNGVGGTSAQLVAAAQQIVNGYVDGTGAKVPGYKVAGVPTTVVAASDVPLVIGGHLTAAAGYNSAALATTANAALATYIEGIEVGSPFLLAEAYALVMAIPGVANWNPAGLTVGGQSLAPADVTPTISQKYIPGALAIAGA